MKQGKFQAGRKAAPAAEQPRRRLIWLWILVPILLLGALAAVLLFGVRNGTPTESGEQRGFSKSETIEQYRNLANAIENGDMVLTLLPSDPEEQDAPIVLTIPPSLSRVRVDLNGLTADLDDGVGKVGWNRYVVDPRNYLNFDMGALQTLADDAERHWGKIFFDSEATVVTISAKEKQMHVLNVNTGRRGVDITAQAILDALMDAYIAGDLQPTLRYQTQRPKPLDAEEIRKSCTTEPIDAQLDMTSFAITPEIPGYGVELSELQELLNNAEEGKTYKLTLKTLPAAVTAEQLDTWLYGDVLGEAHTPHSWIDDRTHNLMLACDEINGTIVMPGEVFSFNETVGQRTAEKGYREATAYVGGASVPEIGGGVCQVASSIYYAVLQADLRTVERRSHTYLVTYVPQGMDAAIYWGSIDYKFENTSPTPIKIEASVSDGDVHIILHGREWKNYTVELHYKVLEEIPWETTQRVVTDGSHKNGDTLVTPYTGYVISTSKTLRDLDGNVIETVHIANNTYRKRDKVVAVVPPPPADPKPSDPGSPDD
ncbi:MAG: VanW family protein [Oscillospiraceae bacterium]|nr:VanW family protein [Oscillospiraceae bacterium]